MRDDDPLISRESLQTALDTAALRAKLFQVGLAATKARSRHAAVRSLSRALAFPDNSSHLCGATSAAIYAL